MPELLAFSAQQVSQLTTLSIRQITYWDRTGFYEPRYAIGDSGRPFGRIYSFQDVVGLRTLARLRNEHRVRLQELRQVSDWLKERYESPWATLRFYVAGQKVFFDEPATHIVLALNPPGQRVFLFGLEEIIQEMQTATKQLQRRSGEDVGRIVRNRYLVHNSPVIAGTRIPTTAIWNFHQDGYSTQQIIREYPRLTPEDVQAGIRYEEQRRQKRAG